MSYDNCCFSDNHQKAKLLPWKHRSKMSHNDKGYQTSNYPNYCAAHSKTDYKEASFVLPRFVK